MLDRNAHTNGALMADRGVQPWTAGGADSVEYLHSYLPASASRLRDAGPKLERQAGCNPGVYLPNRTDARQRYATSDAVLTDQPPATVTH
ncbi:hypothetical protein GCM10010326_21700 [Streptomyces xanthochromogenes]|uniref:Uncharacterized protein n=1 Tax=Streptomyces xanthochromogenes TaxID=67384 RepID=A0ABQ2ZZV6_9ACTN|nr:hypothetical protein GCM10010326_21700 [Streptomyces xanthochromogenes]